MMTRILAVVGVFGLLTVSGAAAAESWSNVALIDTACSIKAKDAPDAHTKACALQCAKSGFGIIAGDGSYLKFDDNGNAKALAALQASSQNDHLRVSVTGERQGETIKVASLRIERK